MIDGGLNLDIVHRRRHSVQTRIICPLRCSLKRLVVSKYPEKHTKA